MKRFAPVLASLVLLLSACGGGAQKPAASSPTGTQPAAAQPAAQPAAQQPKNGVAAIAELTGNDKVEKLVANIKASQETTLNIYTSWNLNNSEPHVAEFKKWAKEKYGFDVRVNLYRASSETMVQKAVAEFKAGRNEADVFEANGPEMEQIAREGLLTPFWLPVMQQYPEGYLAKHRLWHADRLNIFSAAYNTKAIKAEDRPKTYEDLLDPKWKGRMVVEAEDYDWFATLVKQHFGEQKGLEYMKKLGDQGLQVRKGHTLLTTLLASGEIDYVVTAYNYEVQRQKDLGAPVEWYVLEPAVLRAQGVGLAGAAPHPNMGLLFSHWHLSPDGGQAHMAKIGNIPAHPNVPATPPSLNSGFKTVLTDIPALLDEQKKWMELWDKLILKGVKPSS